jgi:hypothetical protein
MQTAREFMQACLREQAAYIQWHHQQHRAFGQKFYSEERLKYPAIGYRFTPFAEQLSTMEISGETALAFTVNAGTGEKWKRYHLRVSQGKWEIYDRDDHCGRCQGTGRYREPMRFCDGQWVAHHQMDNCLICGGSGWRNECLVPKTPGKTAS